MYVNGVSSYIIKEFGLNISSAMVISKNLGVNVRKGIKTGLPKKLSQNYESVKKDYRTGESLKKMLVKTSEYLATSIKSYKGLRNFSGLPSRGQRTKTNAKTKRRVGYKNYRK